MRRAFGDTLIDLARKDNRVIFLTGDLGFQVFDDFKNEFPERYVNVGVAEAALMCAAAGLALEGWKPIAYSIASFATARPYEQIKISICYQELPVVIVGAGGGYTYSNSGVTHQAPEDLGLMGLLPGMTVVAPGCPSEVSALMPQLFELNGPSYFRIGRFGEKDYAADSPAMVGQARELKNGDGVAVLCVGDIAPVVLEACDAVHGSPAVFQFHTTKPLDVEGLRRIAGKYPRALVVEESLPRGGLYAAISAYHDVVAKFIELRRAGPGDEFMYGSLSREDLREKCSCDAAGIAEIINGMI